MPVSIASLLGVLQAIEKIATMRLNRRKLKAEVEKLERENEPPTIKMPQILEKEYEKIKNEEGFDRLLKARGATIDFNRTQRRLVEVRVNIVSIEVQYLTRSDTEKEG